MEPYLAHTTKHIGCTMYQWHCVDHADALYRGTPKKHRKTHDDRACPSFEVLEEYAASSRAKGKWQQDERLKQMQA